MRRCLNLQGPVRAVTARWRQIGGWMIYQINGEINPKSCGNHGSLLWVTDCVKGVQTDRMEMELRYNSYCL
eukprot:1104621-Pyramimonas_sp.AAC.1